MVSKSCPKGTIERKGYTSIRRGREVKVAPSCIQATSARGTKRSVQDRAIIEERNRIQNKMGKKYGHPKCPSGQIERAGFTRSGYKREGHVRKSGSYVKSTNVRPSETPPTCIQDRGKPGKGIMSNGNKEPNRAIKIPVVLEKGILKKAGYQDVKHMSVEDRHAALERAHFQIGNPLSLFRKLIVVSTMNRNNNPKISKIFKDDANWVRDKFGLMITKPNLQRSRETNSKSYSGSKSKNSRIDGDKKSSTRKSTTL